jgi:hypothetical protein
MNCRLEPASNAELRRSGNLPTDTVDCKKRSQEKQVQQTSVRTVTV